LRFLALGIVAPCLGPSKQEARKKPLAAKETVMAQRKWSFLGVAGMAMAAMLLAADSASAQRWGRGFRNGWSGSYYDGRWGGYDGWAGPYRYSGGYPSYYDGGYRYYSPSGYTYGEPSMSTTAFYGPQTGEGLSESSAMNTNTAMIDIRIPDPNAQIWLDGQETKQRGTFRPFVSPPLEQGKTFHYKVRARWQQDGKEMDQTKTVEFKAGQRQVVTFDARASGQQNNPPSTQQKTNQPAADNASKGAANRNSTSAFPSSDAPKGTASDAPKGKAPSPSDKVPPPIPAPSIPK
jgi:uncharacterized protein (TIGR03000 family)